MLFLFNKAKIISYAVSVLTVVVLFVFANNIMSNNEAMSASANINSNMQNLKSNLTNTNSIIY